MGACIAVVNSTALSKRLFLLENDLYLGFNVKICRIKDDFSYRDWEIKGLPGSNNNWTTLNIRTDRLSLTSMTLLVGVYLGIFFVNEIFTLNIKKYGKDRKSIGDIQDYFRS